MRRFDPHSHHDLLDGGANYYHGFRAHQEIREKEEENRVGNPIPANHPVSGDFLPELRRRIRVSVLRAHLGVHSSCGYSIQYNSAIQLDIIDNILLKVYIK
jgi:hypothetical protein